MGTTWQAIIVAEQPPPASLIQERLDQIETIFSTWRDDSAIQLFNQQAHTGWQPVPSELVILAQRALQMAELTQGAYDPTIPPLLKLWGFGPNTHSAQHPRSIPNFDDLQAAKKHVDYRMLEVRLDPPALRKLDPQLRIDLSSLVEGFALDELAKLLKSSAHHHFLLEIGGEMIARGVKVDQSPWTVGVRLPTAIPSQIATTVSLQHEAISTSGTYHQFWEDDTGHAYPHLLDARTGSPIQHSLQSVTVIATSALEADVWSTALLILGPEEGKNLAEQHQIQAFFQENF